MSTTLPLFWHLSSANKKDRIDASVKLVGSLEQFQAEFIPKEFSEESSDEEEAHEATKNDGLDNLNAQDVSYSIRRLIRGLASPRESSRLGFAVALTELLSRVDTVTCSQMVSIIIQSSKTQGSMTGQEERDVLFARLFGLTAVVQSGLLVRETSLVSSASTSTLSSSLDGYKETILQLVALGERRSFLRESAWWTAGLAIDALMSSKVSWKDEAFDVTFQTIFSDNDTWTPEKVAITLKLQAAHPKRDWAKILTPTWKNAELLSTGNLLFLARILKESNPEGSEGAKTTLGNWKPQVHFVWDVVLDQLLIQRTPSSTKASFQEFFRVVVDESLFSSTSSAERKYWGFQIFQKALPRISATEMPMLFTKNFMRTWINHLSNNDRYLHKAARQVAVDIQAFVAKNPTLGFTLILQLTGTNGNCQFDRLTRTKTVESILASMDAEGIEKYIDYLLGQVNGESKEDNITTVNARRAWIIEQLGALIRNGSIPKTDRWIQYILDWLILNGFFIIKKKSEKSRFRTLQTPPSPVFSDDLRLSCRNRLLNCLADLTGQVTLIKSDDKSSKESAVASDGVFWISRALATIDVLVTDTRHVELIQHFEDDDQAVILKARKLIETLKDVTPDRRDSAKGAELLLSGTVLQQYAVNEEDIGTEVLEACVEATSLMFASKKKKSKKTSQPSGDADEAEPIDVLVDSIIGLLEQSTSYLRTVGNQVFSLLSGSVQDTSIDLILRQLEPRNPAELVDEEEDVEMEDDLDDEGDVPSDTDHDEESEDAESASGEGESEEEEGDDEDVQELRRKIEEALKVNGIEAATGDSDEESDEDLMDDDQMMAIDEQLAAVFKSQASEKKSSKDVDAQREATHFKNRVLDLVDIFIKKQPTSRHTARFILPLLDLIAGTGADEKQMADKATGILRNRISKSKDVPPGVDIEFVSTILEEVHYRARRARSPDALVTLNQCSLYLTRVLLHSGTDETVLRIYRESLIDFASRKASSLNANFIHDFLRRNSESGWNLREDILDSSNKAANVYRKCQILQLLQTTLNQLPASGDRQKEVLSFMPKCSAFLLDFTIKACQEDSNFTAAQIKDILKLSLVAVRQTQRVAPGGTTRDIWKPTSWEKMKEGLASSERFKASVSLQTMCQQLVNVAQGPTDPKGRKKAEVNGAGEPKAPSKRKAVVASDNIGPAGTRDVKRKKVQKAKV